MQNRFIVFRPWMLAAVVGTAGCAEDDARDAASSGEPGAVRASVPALGPTAPPSEHPVTASLAAMSSCDQPLDAGGIPYVGIFFQLSDACPSRHAEPVSSSATSVQLTRDEAGGACLRGRLTSGWASLVVGLDGSNTNGAMPLPEMLEPLDADAHGITGLQFTLDRPPAGGISLSTGFVVGENCFPNCELHGDYYVLDDSAPGVTRRFDQAGTYSLSFADFQPAPWADPTLALDTTHLAGLFFEVGPSDFDFCLRDLRLLDASGAPVP